MAKDKFASAKRQLRSENPVKGGTRGLSDAAVKKQIAMNKAGLTSDGETQRALNNMTNAGKASAKRASDIKKETARTGRKTSVKNVSKPVASGGIPAKRHSSMKAGAMGGAGSMDVYATPQERIKRKLK